MLIHSTARSYWKCSDLVLIHINKKRGCVPSFVLHWVFVSQEWYPIEQVRAGVRVRACINVRMYVLKYTYHSRVHVHSSMHLLPHCVRTRTQQASEVCPIELLESEAERADLAIAAYVY